MRVYISGPITKADPKRIHAFYLAERRIKATGHVAINPHIMADWSLTWETYMALAQTILYSGEVDAILLLAGWEWSRGACIEKVWAEANGIPVYYVDPKSARRYEWVDVEVVTDGR